MAEAYAVILVAGDLFDNHKRETVEMAQREADRKFEAIAVEARLTMVTRNPEPRVMTHQEMRNAFPMVNLENIVGLYFTADIT